MNFATSYRFVPAAQHLSLERALSEVEALCQVGEWTRAEFQVRQVLEEFPQTAQAWNLLGVISAGREGGLFAVDCLERAVGLEPNNATFHTNLGEIWRRGGVAERAVRHSQRALELEPNLALARLNLGFALLEAGQALEALAQFKALVERLPDLPSAWFGLARSSLTGQDLATALQALQRCTALAPADPEPWILLGRVLQQSGDLAGAQTCVARAERVAPTHPGMVALKADLLSEAGHAEASEAALQAGLVAAPQAAGLRYRLSLALLSRGLYPEGFALYEGRLDLGDSDVSNRIRRPLLPMPEWRGEPLQGRRLLVMTEQGFGDHLQFCRFVEPLARQGAQVVMGVAPPLADLMRTLPGCEHVITTFDEARNGRCDHWVFVGSLPQRLGVTASTVTPRQPYLRADDARRQGWRSRLTQDADPRPRVGLVWGGRPSNEYERRRSLPWQAVQSLLAVPGLRWVSLQTGPRRADLDALPEPLKPLALTEDALGSFADTAALLAELDLLVSVDTAYAHLAGATGRPVWVLLPRPCDWRWCLQDERSPWYPSARLFRQALPGQWAPVIEQVRAALAMEFNLAASAQPPGPG